MTKAFQAVGKGQKDKALQIIKDAGIPEAEIELELFRLITLIPLHFDIGGKIRVRSSMAAFFRSYNMIQNSKPPTCYLNPERKDPS
jgi:hypothetical protein